MAHIRAAAVLEPIGRAAMRGAEVLRLPADNGPLWICVDGGGHRPAPSNSDSHLAPFRDAD